MSHSPKSALLSAHVALLVEHFGIERVRAELDRVRAQEDEGFEPSGGKVADRRRMPGRASVTKVIESIRGVQPEKYRLLSDFLARLVDRRVLAESQDIRHFAQLVGLKELMGKSRKEMVPQLMRFLSEQPIERLRSDLPRADRISEQQRRMGFSVLTDKLLEK